VGLIARFIPTISQDTTADDGFYPKDTIQVGLPVPVLKYGLPIDSFHIVSDRIRRNQNLASILQHYKVDAYTVDKIARRAEGIFDFRGIRAGNDYCLFFPKDSLSLPSYFVYEQTPVDYVVIDLKDSINVTLNKKQVITKRARASGEIQYSLWETMKTHEVNPVVALELSEIYAWCIDFFGLQEGDKFKVIYHEEFVDSVSVGIAKIESAWFKHADEEFYAIPFVQDSTESFYDHEGNSLRKAFLKAPLRFSRISSRFSHSRLHPVLKIRRPHHGVDYAAPTGTPVVAIGDGKIIKKGYHGGAGHMVKIRHNSIYTTAYLHLSRYGNGIKNGAYVKQGDIIGYVGSTGLSTGPHLDFRFYKYNSPVDPLRVEAPPVDPVKSDNRPVFDSIRNQYMFELNAIALEPVELGNIMAKKD
jgi:murein DD-endopeptidase MepM/ murein hydrolase activator NlpD